MEREEYLGILKKYNQNKNLIKHAYAVEGVDIDEYIITFPEEIQVRLHEIRNVIKEVTPEETIEKISWSMPRFYLYGNLVL